MKSSLTFNVKSLTLAFAALLFIFSGLLISSCKPAIKKTEPIDQSKESGVAKFVFSEEIHNFGPLMAGEVVSFTFIFKNGGTKALTITSVDSGCGCTEVKIPNKTIEPGQEGQIEVVYNSAGEVGRELKTITLFSNADEPKKQLFIKADITNKVIEINS